MYYIDNVVSLLLVASLGFVGLCFKGARTGV